LIGLGNRSQEIVSEVSQRGCRALHPGDPVVISKGIKELKKNIREDETIATAITMPQESLNKNRQKILI